MDTDMEESLEGGSHAGDQSFSGGLSTTEFEGASLEVGVVTIAQCRSCSGMLLQCSPKQVLFNHSAIMTTRMQAGGCLRVSCVSDIS